VMLGIGRVLSACYGLLWGSLVKWQDAGGKNARGYGGDRGGVRV